MSTQELTGVDPTMVAMDHTLAPRAGIAFELFKDQILRIIDVEGQQVVDVICFARQNYEDKISPHNTILLNGTIYLTTGHSLYSTDCTRLMTIVEDTNGVHDILAGSCSTGSNRFRYGDSGTANCRSNFEEALRPFGIPMREVPYSFNVFMNVPVERDRTAIIEPTSKPGDYIDLRADTDLLVAASNCPQERNPCNAFRPTSMRLVVFNRKPAGDADTAR